MDADPSESLDAALILRVAEGDVDALASLYDRHVDALLAIALRIVHDRAEAEDLVHDAFMGLCEQARRYDPARGRLRTWLVTITRNLAIDRLRRQNRLKRVREAVRAEARTETAEAPPLDFLPLNEKFREAFGALPEDQRLTLEAAFFQGLSYSEIAELHGVPLGTVKSRAARAIATLREALLASVQNEPSSVVVKNAGSVRGAS
ncbi:sigma-70 family RNA polymerase sigma factor [Pendulispora brunnea]|uniref:Sigma-70 family RNA polymerase sigma factor n=1 Tax=Pendulispora brunnea TaxID=2905690 RepID=A0ABZ2KI25_9BACT